ncbi:MAG: nickel-responsive transcriptional regulator NikR [Candidatus Lokiarchaeota archaeon]|nr:nickel-responsive transcriptional regulator NikR [Candidatus Lokiarchaeota archaeon]
MTEEKFIRFSVSLSEDLLNEFDKIRQLSGFETRSDAIRAAMRDFIIEKRAAMELEGNRAGTITIILDHHGETGVMDQLTDLEHHNRSIITANLHIHLDHENCMNILAVRGDMGQIKKLINKLNALPLKYIRPTLTVPGEEIPK